MEGKIRVVKLNVTQEEYTIMHEFFIMLHGETRSRNIWRRMMGQMIVDMFGVHVLNELEAHTDGSRSIGIRIAVVARVGKGFGETRRITERGAKWLSGKWFRDVVP